MKWNMETAVVVICAFALLLCMIGLLSQLRSEVRHVNFLLEKIAQNAGVSLVPENIEELKALIAEGKQIEAVKRYRKITGAALKDAKDYIDQLAGKSES